MNGLKLSDWASIADVIAGVAVVISLAILIAEVRGNTEAVIATNRQSTASRVEQIALTVATDPVLAELLNSEPNELDSADSTRVAAFYVAILRSTEETFLQYSEGRLDEDYFLNRLHAMLPFLQSRQGQAIWRRSSDRSFYDSRFVDRVNEILAEVADE